MTSWYVQLARYEAISPSDRSSMLQPEKFRVALCSDLMLLKFSSRYTKECADIRDLSQPGILFGDELEHLQILEVGQVVGQQAETCVAEFAARHGQLEYHQFRQALQRLDHPEAVCLRGSCSSHAFLLREV